MPYTALTEASATLITPGNLGTPLTSIGETLASLRAELILQLGNRADVTLERAALWINFAYRGLCASLELDDLKGSLTFELVTGQPLYKLPPEVFATRNLAVVDNVTYGDLGGRVLTKTDLTNYRMRPMLSEEPKEYFRERNLLVLWPTPSNVRTVSMDYWIRPDDLVNDTDSPILPVEWHETILMNARKKGYSALQDFEKSIVANNDLVDDVRGKEGRDEREDSNRVVLSSVPRRKGQLIRRSTNNFFGEDHE